VLRGRVERSEQGIGLLIAGLPVGISAVILAFGVDPRLAAITGLVLFLWPWWVSDEGPPASEDVEYAYLRSRRVRLYLAGLLLLVPLNGLVFFYSLLLAPLVVILASFLLATTFGLMSQGPLRDMNPSPSERTDYKEMVSAEGSAAIWLSNLLLWVDLLAVTKIYAGSVWWVSVPVYFALAFYQLSASLNREKTSRGYARSLADSLRRRKWWKQFEAKKGARTQKKSP
jgi:hypothetical protein